MPPRLAAAELLEDMTAELVSRVPRPGSQVGKPHLEIGSNLSFATRHQRLREHGRAALPWTQ
jgi:hypothetical protein